MPRGRGPKKSRGGASGGKPDGAPEDFHRDLVQRMDACPTAEALNDEVIMPFVTALEDVLGKRGYVMNIYGETANLVFTGKSDDADAIYQIVEAYLDDQSDD